MAPIEHLSERRGVDPASLDPVPPHSGHQPRCPRGRGVHRDQDITVCRRHKVAGWTLALRRSLGLTRSSPSTGNSARTYMALREHILKDGAIPVKYKLLMGMVTDTIAAHPDGVTKLANDAARRWRHGKRDCRSGRSWIPVRRHCGASDGYECLHQNRGSTISGTLAGKTCSAKGATCPSAPDMRCQSRPKCGQYGIRISAKLLPMKHQHWRHFSGAQPYCLLLDLRARGSAARCRSDDAGLAAASQRDAFTQRPRLCGRWRQPPDRSGHRLR